MANLWQTAAILTASVRERTSGLGVRLAEFTLNGVNGLAVRMRSSRRSS